MELELTKTNLTPEIVKNDHAVTLSKLGYSITKFHELERAIVYNEDNLSAMDNLIDQLKAAKKVVANEHEKEKKPVLEKGRILDEGKRLMFFEIDKVLNNVSVNKTIIAERIEKRNKEEKEATEKREKDKKLVDNTIMLFSEKIAVSNDITELLDIERDLNRELTITNQKKYGEFTEEFTTRCNGIRTLIADRKNSVRLLSELDKKGNHATETGQDEHLEGIMNKKQELEESLSENSIKIQETASQQAKTTTTKVEQQFASVKPRRTTDEYEFVNKDLAFKKLPGCFVIEEIKANIKTIGKELRENGTWKDGEEFVYNGIRFYEKKTYA